MAPVGVLVLAGAVSAFDEGELGEVGRVARLRAWLALLLQGVGGDVSVRYGDSFAGVPLGGEVALSATPLAVTAVWVLLTVLTARRARRRHAVGTAAETALRVGAVAAVAAWALALVAQPKAEGGELSGAPWSVLLWSFVLTVVAVWVALASRPAVERPGARMVHDVASGAGAGLVGASLLAGASVCGYLLATQRELGAEGAVALLLVLPNLGLNGLALAWGASLRASSRLPGLELERQSLGYAQAGDAASWAPFALGALGVACALLVGLALARRCRARAEQLLGGGLFVCLLLAATAVAGARMTASLGGGTAPYPGEEARAEFGAALDALLLASLLWTLPAVLLAPWLLRLARRPRPNPTSPQGTCATGGAPPPTGRPLARTVAWTAAASLAGGALTAGLLSGSQNQDVRPGAPRASDPEETPPARDAESPGSSPVDPEDDGKPPPPPGTAAPRPAELPDGFSLRRDPAGFTVGVMDGWERTAEGTRVDYAPPTGPERLRIGAVEATGASPLENFRALEEQAQHREGYERHELRADTFRGRPGARWEFSHTDEESGRRLHTVDQAYVAEDGTEYSIRFEGRAEAWDPHEDVVLSTALHTWEVPGADG
ncbi:hypothetical protein [Streptomyces sulphureus]|uniref:hypothetical protein n=1 Tax=Streptomyces sulphureus TaxID=47758 RepID=UPI00039CC367|nr:hypothetical protein [Streptomyces sulphureus]